MNASVFHRYGSPREMTLEQVPVPTLGSNDVLIKSEYTTVTAGDCEARRSDFPSWVWLPLRLYFGVLKPRFKVLGQEVSGTVVCTGSDVTKFKVGDQVAASAGMSFGTYAEYVKLPEDACMIRLSEGANMEAAATIPTGGLNGLHFVRKAEVKDGDVVLINGAGGSIGTYAIQFAKQLGAYVIAVDSLEKHPMLLQAGADEIIDYKKTDFTRTNMNYDVIIDIVGHSHYSRSVRSLKTGGRYVLGNPSFSGMLRSVMTPMLSSKKVYFEFAEYSTELMTLIADQIEDGSLEVIIDRALPLSEMHTAHALVESGKKKGNLIIDFSAS